MNDEIQPDALNLSGEAALDLSVVCPFFNEEEILANAIEQISSQLAQFKGTWELIVVNDGSTDRSAQVAHQAAFGSASIRVLGYQRNRGRGHALRTGIREARGAIIVTTEIDLSWGDDIVERLYQALTARPDVDIVVASPHMEGGGYRNVPFGRVFLSRFGNRVIRACVEGSLTMNTGMTRAYRRELIQSLPLIEDEKEFHLEVVLKARAFQARFAEIPAVLEWKEHRLAGQRVKRKSKSKINRLVWSHSLFSLIATPTRYLWALAALASCGSAAFLAAGVIRYSMGMVSVYMLIVSLGLATIALLLFAIGVLSEQSHRILQELWRVQRAISPAPNDSMEVASEENTGKPISG